MRRSGRPRRLTDLRLVVVTVSVLRRHARSLPPRARPIKKPIYPDCAADSRLRSEPARWRQSGECQLAPGIFDEVRD
jgi:hypothetical protein